MRAGTRRRRVVGLPVGIAVVLSGVLAGGGAVAGPAAAAAGSADRHVRTLGTSASQAEIQALADSIVAAGSPGAVVYLRDGDVVTEAASGVADVATGRAMRARTAYRIGSVTKSVVATRIAQLAESGTVGLDRPVAGYLPGLLPDGPSITLRMLLQHTSGLFNYTEDPAWVEKLLTGADFTPGELVGYANRHPLNFPPGTSWSYSNTGYIVLGMVINAVTTGGVDRQLRSRVLQPAGADDTWFPRTRKTLGPAAAHGYIGQPDPLPPLLDVTSLGSPTSAFSAGALVSNTHEMADFYRALLRDELTTAATVEEMTDTVVGGHDLGYGLGLTRIDLCVPTWGHDGLYPGYYTIALSSRDAARQVVAMMNVDPENGYPPVVYPAFAVAAVSAFCGSGSPAARSATSLPLGTDVRAAR